MRTLLSRLWRDDSGAALSVELILIIAILVFGVIPGLVALRNSLNAFLGSLANMFEVLSRFDQHHDHGSGGGGSANLVVAQPIPPIDVGPVSISPAP